MRFGALGSSVTIGVVVRDAEGNELEDPRIDWSSDGPDIAVVDPIGAIRARANGATTIRAASGAADASVSVTVQQVVDDLVIASEIGRLVRVGQSAAVRAFVADSNGNAIETAAAPDLENSDPDAIHLAPDGTATAMGAGSATITARAEGLEASVTIQVDLSGPHGPPIIGQEVACTGGFAGLFPCQGMDLVAYLPPSALGAEPQTRLNDIWGWTDAATGRRWALAARGDGVTFVDVTDPLRPRAMGHLPAAAAATFWRDVKVYADHAYVVADASPGHGVQVFDLTRLRGLEVFTVLSEDARYTQLGSVHNIAINEETGFAYAVGAAGSGNTCGGGLHMIDLSSPAAPSFAGCFADPTTGRMSTGYVHDVQCIVYSGPDAAFVGREVCFGANETAISIVDVTDKAAPVSLATATYPNVQYAHQGWLTEDHRYFIFNDELDESAGGEPSTRMLIWDVTDLEDPILVREHAGPTSAIDHNVFITGDTAWQSNYTAGLRAVDVSDPLNPIELGRFDTVPDDDSQTFNGNWSSYPFFGGDVVVLTSRYDGLFVLRLVR